jgi:hypothetical protein
LHRKSKAIGDRSSLSLRYQGKSFVFVVLFAVKPLCLPISKSALREVVDEFVISGASVDRIEFFLPRSLVATGGHNVNASLGGAK